MKRALDGHRGGLRRLPAGLRPRAREPVVRGVHDRRRRHHPGRHGHDLAADQGRRSATCARRARRSASCACAGSGRSRPRSSWRPCRRPRRIGVIDRDYSFGSPFDSGVVANEIRAAMYNADKRPPLLSLHLRPRRPRGHAGGRLQGDRHVLRGRDVRQVRRQDALARRARIGDDDTWLTTTDVQQRDADPRALPGRQAGHDRGVLHLRATGPARAASRRWS